MRTGEAKGWPNGEAKREAKGEAKGEATWEAKGEAEGVAKGEDRGGQRDGQKGGQRGGQRVAKGEAKGRGQRVVAKVGGQREGQRGRSKWGKLSHPLVYHATMYWRNRLHTKKIKHLSQRKTVTQYPHRYATGDSCQNFGNVFDFINLLNRSASSGKPALSISMVYGYLATFYFLTVMRHRNVIDSH